MSSCAAQVSVYPLRQPHLSAAIDTALQIFHNRSLKVETTGMATLIVGDSNTLFDRLKEAFQAVAATGDVVMVVTVSNACPSSEPPREKS